MGDKISSGPHRSTHTLVELDGIALGVPNDHAPHEPAGLLPNDSRVRSGGGGLRHNGDPRRYGPAPDLVQVVYPKSDMVDATLKKRLRCSRWRFGELLIENHKRLVRALSLSKVDTSSADDFAPDREFLDGVRVTCNPTTSVQKGRTSSISPTPMAMWETLRTGTPTG
jgi:hypothetical protein